MAIHGYPGGVVSATAPTVSPLSASGVWTLVKQLYYHATDLLLPRLPISTSFCQNLSPVVKFVIFS